MNLRNKYLIPYINIWYDYAKISIIVSISILLMEIYKLFFILEFSNKLGWAIAMYESLNTCLIHVAILVGPSGTFRWTHDSLGSTNVFL